MGCFRALAFNDFIGQLVTQVLFVHEVSAGCSFVICFNFD